MLARGVGLGPPAAKTLRCISRIASMPLNSRPLGRVKQASSAYKAIRPSRSRARMLAKYRSVTSAGFILILQIRCRHFVGEGVGNSSENGPLDQLWPCGDAGSP